MNEDQDFNLGQQIAELRGIVVEGFKGVHFRQDTTNGRIGKAEDRLKKLELEEAKQAGKDSGIRMTWGKIAAIISTTGILVGIIFKLLP